MTKKGPLGKAEIYYVKGHYKGSEAKQIAKELDRPISAIQRTIDELSKEDAGGKKGAGEQMARQEGVVVMTENSSSTSEANKIEATMNSRTRTCVTKIKND